MGFLSGNNNVVLVSQCNNLQGLTVTFQVTEDLVTLGNKGFGLQLNCFPQAGQVFQNQTLNWFQYAMIIGNPNDQKVSWAVEYWNTIGPKTWPSGYTPNPPNTVPQRPVIPNDSGASPFASAPSNQILAGSIVSDPLSTSTQQHSERGA